MAMPRPSGKALRIAKQTVPGLRAKPSDNANPMKARGREDVEEKQTAAILNPFENPSQNKNRLM